MLPRQIHTTGITTQIGKPNPITGRVTTTIWNSGCATEVPACVSAEHVERLQALRAFNKLTDYQRLRINEQKYASAKLKPTFGQR